MIPVRLQEEVTDLEKVGYQIQLFEVGNRVYIQFDNYQLPEGGYTLDSTSLIIWTHTSYPSCAFDMFWVDPRLLLLGNRMPHAASVLESHLGRSWRRFSIHPYKHKKWNPNEDGLEVYLSYINNRLNHLR